MVKKPTTRLLALVLVLLSSVPVWAQAGARWSGIVKRSNREKSTLTVHARGSSNEEKVIHYDSSTKWNSQEHGSKKINEIDASQVKDGDRVICIGYYDDKGDFQAVLVSKRLSQ